MYAFDDIAAVESTLNRLMALTPDEEASTKAVRPLVAAMPRQPGSREVRYMHLLCGPIGGGARGTEETTPAAAEARSENVLAERIGELEQQMQALQSMISRLEARLKDQPAHPEHSGNGSAG